MLQRLSIRNLALLRAIDTTWGPHLNILTGETGAGKSLLIEAVGALLGLRVDMPPLESRAVIEAEFAPIPSAIQAFLEETDSLYLRCEIAASGRRRYFLNDSPIQVADLRPIALHLIEIHSQHETQQLFHSHYQQALLDAYAGLGEAVESFRQHYEAWRKQKEAIEAYEAQAHALAQKRAWLENQLAQVPAHLSLEEYQALEQQIKRLEHQSLVLSTLQQWFTQLNETPQNPIQTLSQAIKTLSRLPIQEKPLEEAIELLENARIAVQEALEQLTQLSEQFAIDPAEAERLQSRYDLYNALLLRFQVPTVELLLETIQNLRQEYEHLVTQETAIGPSREAFGQQTSELLLEAYRLELARTAAAQVLSDEVQRFMRDLGLGDAYFHIAVERLQDPQSSLVWDEKPVRLTPLGFSQVTFLLRTNPGFPLAPLAEVASGGELSRIMLALKAALAEKIALPTLILDEIDTGLSGESAQRMGHFLARLAQKMQIILITHLPVIAAQRGQHFFIAKQVQAGYAETSVRPLDAAERVLEIARLLSGEAENPAAQEAAQALLRSDEA